MKHFQFFVRIAIAFALIANVAGLSSPQVSAQADACTVAQIYNLKQQRQSEALTQQQLAKRIRGIKQSLADMNTDDPKIINANYAKAISGANLTTDWLGSAAPKDLKDVVNDRLDFWREKKREIDAAGTKGIIDITAGGKLRAYFRSALTQDEELQQQATLRLQELDKELARCQGGATTETSSCATSIVGTWHWWNGLTVTFSPGGGASYRGSATGSGSWQHTGGSSYHAHWNAGNTNDYFTLSRDGTKIEGQFDGKPGTSTRKC